jgi:hypothetical protein
MDLAPARGSIQMALLLLASLSLAGGARAQVIPGPECYLPPPIPAVLQSEVSVPAEGSGASCRIDPDCPSSEFCWWEVGQSGGYCGTWGHTIRDNIRYIAGSTVDVTLTIPACTKISDVTLGGTSLSCTGFDCSAPGSWEILSSVPTTFNGQAAVRVAVRVRFTNFGDGSSPKLRLIVRAVRLIKGQPIAYHEFTLARVAAVNAPIQITIGKSAMTNGFVAKVYSVFGDFGLYQGDPPERLVSSVDWDALSSDGLGYRNTGIEIQQGAVAFNVEGQVDAFCGGHVWIGGRFTLVPSSDAVQIQWQIGPYAKYSVSTFCSITTGGIANVVGSIYGAVKGLEDQILASFLPQFQGGLGADENGRIQICPGCRVLDVKIQPGRIDIYAIPPVERVRVNVSTTQYRDATAQPQAYGLALPPDHYVALAPAQLVTECVVANGTKASLCESLPVDAAGVFNWLGKVPVPNPWVSTPLGPAYFAARHGAWNRLRGVTRDPALLPLPVAAFDVGALMARLGDGTESNLRRRVTPGCVVPPSGRLADFLALGVNDVPSVGTEAPTAGKFEVSVLLANQASASLVLFGSAPKCPSDPSVIAAPAPDADEDGSADGLDNCVLVANPTQIDTDEDGYGNACDADITNDGIVNFVDLARLKQAFFTDDPIADLSGDGVVNFGDLAILKNSFFKAPGPAAGKP